MAAHHRDGQVPGQQRDDGQRSAHPARHHLGQARCRAIGVVIDRSQGQSGTQRLVLRVDLGVQ